MMKQRQRSKHDGAYKKYDLKDSGVEDDSELLLLKCNKPQKREIPFVEKTLEDMDTLQSLAIRYHCTIEELKRLNNIEKENEIYAKPTIKVPHRPIFSFLAGVHISGASSPEQDLPSTSFDPQQLNSTLNSINQNQDNEVNEIIFNSNIAQKVSTNSDSLLVYEDDDNGFNDEINLLPQPAMLQQPEQMISRIKWNGADGDISVLSLIAIIVVLIVVVPIVYVFYAAEHPEVLHHEKHNTT